MKEELRKISPSYDYNKEWTLDVCNEQSVVVSRCPCKYETLKLIKIVTNLKQL